MTPGTITSVVLASALATAITHATLRSPARSTDLPQGAQGSASTARQDGCDIATGECPGTIQVAYQPTRCSLPADRE